MNKNGAARMLFPVSLVLIAMGVLMIPGAEGYVLFDDSGSYIEMERYMEGVMPVYPLFLRLNKVLFGEGRYLQIVIVEQALFAGVCVAVLTELIRRRFGLRYWQGFCVFAFLLLPFTTDMPDAMTTQEILTEGIAYAAYYLFFALYLETAWTKRRRYVLYLFLVTLFLSSLRSQLQILFGADGILFFYIMLTGSGTAPKKRMALRAIAGAAGCLCVSVIGVWCTSRISVAYQDRIAHYTAKLQAELSADSAERGAEESADAEQGEREEEQENRASVSQYDSLIFARGMYEADYEDYLLFEDELMQRLFLRLYDTAKQNESLYPYARPGLWMWKDIVGGIGASGSKCFQTLAEFYKSLPEYAQRDDLRLTWHESAKEIGLTLLKAHWGRFLYHTLLLLPQAFICTVFYQIESVYLLCHLVTLFLYVTAAAMMIWAYADRKTDRAYGEFMAAVLGINLIMIFALSLVFFGQQRYLVYNFGIFYVIYFLLVLQLWERYGKNRVAKWKDQKES